MPADEITAHQWNGERSRQEEQGQSDDSEDADQPEVGSLGPDEVTSGRGRSRAKTI